MPQSYAGQGMYRVSCNDCGASATTHGIPTAASTIADGMPGSRSVTNQRLRTGSPIVDAFSWDRNGSRYYSICKACKAARIAARRAEWAAARVAGEAAANAAPVATTPNLDRRFGVEIECIAPVSHTAIQQALHTAGLTTWRVKYDGSLRGGGAEIVSPVLQGDEGVEQVKTACRVLRRIGARVDRSCGLHVHHEIRDMTVEQVKGLARNWSQSQHVIDGLVAPSRRNGANTYCGRLSSTDLANIERCTDLSRLSQAVTTRYRTLNLACYGRYGTVEIRQHQGTLDAEKIVTWLRLGQAMIEAARAATAMRPASVRQLIEALPALDETAGTYLLGRAVRFGAVAV